MKKSILFLGYLLIVSGLIAEKAAPMTTRPNVLVQDGEYLVYGIYTGGVKSSDFHMVTKFNDDGTVKTFMQMQNVNSTTPLPTDYQDFQWQATVNLKTASMMTFRDDSENYFVKQNKGKGIYFLQILFGKEISAIEKSWDGYESREKKYRVRNVDTNFPIWTLEGFLLWGSRLLDWEASRGSVYIWATMFKDPIPGTLYKMKNERVTTTLGDFETDKVGWRIADPFLGALVKQLTDSMTFNIEKGPMKRAIQIDIQSGGQKWALEHFSVVTN